jgi:spermidine synthase
VNLRSGTRASCGKSLWLAALVAVGSGACDRGAASQPAEGAAERAEQSAAEIAQRYAVEVVPPAGLDLVTEYSTLRIQDLGLQRALWFVRDDGTLALQTRLNLARPDLLMVPYTRTMFASYLFHPRPSRVLIVGVGGGAMIRFLERREPELLIDAVDIDPEVVAIADRYFATRPTQRIRILAADGYHFIRSTDGAAAPTYDVIYLDAFLRPSEETDRAGSPLRLKQAPFYSALRQRLSPTGVAVFNLNPQPERQGDLDELRHAFAQVYVFEVDQDLNWIAVATQDPSRLAEAELRQLAAELEPRFGDGLAFTGMIDRLQPGTARG